MLSVLFQVKLTAWKSSRFYIGIEIVTFCNPGGISSSRHTTMVAEYCTEPLCVLIIQDETLQLYFGMSEYVFIVCPSQ